MHRQQGFGLIEVLIALLISAFGLMSMAGLQVTGLRNSHHAYQGTMATILAAEMADRMRANQEALNSGSYAQANSTSYAICESTGCSAAQRAEHDTYEWTNAINTNLFSGQGLVCIDSTPDKTDTPAAPACDGLGDVYTIKIWWDEDRNGAIDEPYILSVTP